MRVAIFMLIFIAYFVEKAISDGHHRKDVHVKIFTPVYKHVHKHTHTIIKKPKEDKKIIIHQHHHHHGHDHGHKHDHDHKHNHGHKHGHNHGHKHKHNHQHHNIKGQHDHDEHDPDWTKDHHDWHNHYHTETYKSGGDFKPSPEIDSLNLIPSFKNMDSYEHPQHVDDDGYLNSHKTLRTANFHITEAKNSAASDPITKHYVTGSYKVHESDPHDYLNVERHKIFEAPLANIHLHETSYEPSGPENNQEANAYGQVEEGKYGYNGGEFEDDSYEESVLNQKSSEPQRGVNGIEALQQYFQNEVK